MPHQSPYPSISTRERILLRLRRSPATVNQLAAELNVTDNAIRAHLQALEAKGEVKPAGTMPGVRRPHAVYGLTPGAERAFGRAHAPVLAKLLAVLRQRLAPAKFNRILRETGRELAPTPAREGAALRQRLQAVLQLLGELGGMAEVRETDGVLTIQGHGCPLGGIAAEQPDVCKVAEALVAKMLGRPVRERCEKGPSARCRFEVPAARDP